MKHVINVTFLSSVIALTTLVNAMENNVILVSKEGDEIPISMDAAKLSSILNAATQIASPPNQENKIPLASFNTVLLKQIKTDLEQVIGQYSRNHEAIPTGDTDTDQDKSRTIWGANHPNYTLSCLVNASRRRVRQMATQLAREEPSPPLDLLYAADYLGIPELIPKYSHNLALQILAFPNNFPNLELPEHLSESVLYYIDRYDSSLFGSKQKFIPAPFWANANAVSFSPDGTRLMISSLPDPDPYRNNQHSCVRIIDTQTHKTVKTYHFGSHTYIQFSPDGTKVAIAPTGCNGYPKIVDPKTGNTLATLPLQYHVLSVVFSPKDPIILITEWKSSLERGTGLVLETGWASKYSTETGTFLSEILRANSSIKVQFSPDGTKILAVTGNTAHITNALTDVEIATIRHNAEIVAAQFFANNTKVFTSSDKSVRISNTRTGDSVVEIPHDGRLVRHACLFPDEAKLLTYSDEDFVCIHDSKTGGFIAEIPHDDCRRPAQVSPDGTKIATAFDNTIYISDALTGETILSIPCNKFYLEGCEEPTTNDFAAEFSPDSTEVLIVEGRRAKLYQTATDSERRAKIYQKAPDSCNRYVTHDYEIFGAGFLSTDGTRIFTTSKQGVTLHTRHTKLKQVIQAALQAQNSCNIL